MTITLRLLEHRDINLLRELRNASREHFFNTSTISPEKQQKWWETYYADTGFAIYVIQSGNTPVGFISVRSLPPYWPKKRFPFHVCEVGNLLTAPAYRNQGIMTEALCEIRRLWPNVFWVAHVKNGNDASLRLFERAGFWRVPK